MEAWSKKLATFNGRNLHLVIIMLLLFVLSNQHFVTHFKFNFALCVIQNWRWQNNCRNMFLKSFVRFLKFVTYLLLSRHLSLPLKRWQNARQPFWHLVLLLQLLRARWLWRNMKQSSTNQRTRLFDHLSNYTKIA